MQFVVPQPLQRDWSASRLPLRRLAASWGLAFSAARRDCGLPTVESVDTAACNCAGRSIRSGRSVATLTIVLSFLPRFTVPIRATWHRSIDVGGCVPACHRPHAATGARSIPGTKGRNPCGRTISRRKQILHRLIKRQNRSGGSDRGIAQMVQNGP